MSADTKSLLPSSALALDDFDARILHMHAAQTQRVPIPKLIVALVIAGMAARTGSAVLVGGWAILYAVLLGVRWQAMRVLDARTSMPARKRLRIAVILSAIDGTWMGLGLAFFPGMPQFERAMQTILVAGLSAGSAATGGAHRPIFLAYMLPTLVPLAAVWSLSSGFDQPWLQQIMAVLVIMFAIALDSLSRDVSRMVRESFQIREERAELNRSLQAALTAAETASRAKTRFLASASHDLRQPIQTISLFAAALTLRPLDERSRAIAVSMNEALKDLNLELGSLLDVSKLDAGLVEVRMEGVPLRPMIGRVADVFATAAEAKRLQLTLVCPSDACVRSDRNHLERIVRNLVENALKYTEAGQVSIVVEREGESWILSVADTGCGIPASEQSRIFEEFYQVDNPHRDRKRGLGLGLSIVRRLTEILGIDLALRSTPGVGTRVALTLQMARPDSTESTDLPVRDEWLASLHVLVVDDEDSVRRGMSALLEEWGCRVTTVADSREAIAACADRPDIVLSDLRLAGEDNGIDLIREIRRRHGEIPALMISGDTAPERLLEAEAAGIPMLHKPITADVMRRAIANQFPGKA